MTFRFRSPFLCAALVGVAQMVQAGNSLHTTWLWHLHQPVYWPDRRAGVGDHSEAAWDTIQQQDGGRPHPAPEVLRKIFGLDERLDPVLEFNLTTFQSAGESLTRNWNVMPGWTYELEFVDALGGNWSNVSASLTTVGPMQVELGFSTPVGPSPVQRFYRLKLLP